MSKNLVIVESPAKAKTIKKYLGSDYEVLASYGHVRDLVPKDGAVDTEHGFAMKYQVIDRNEKHVRAISQALKSADTLILATDPDREGEAIAWHLVELLHEKKLLKDIDNLKRALPEMQKLTSIEPELAKIREEKKQISGQLDAVKRQIDDKEDKIQDVKQQHRTGLAKHNTKWFLDQGTGCNGLR